MRRVLSVCALLAVIVSLLGSHLALAAAPLRALILTSPGIYHNYEQQTRDIAHAIAEHGNVRFDVSLAELERWKTTDFAAGYDVLIYNICMADNEDDTLIANLRRQTEELGVPAVIIHCTVHSFRNTEAWWPLFGLRSTSHEALASLPQMRSGDHPILTGLPEQWTVANDELYTNLEFDGRTLLAATGEDGQANTTAWLADNNGAAVFGTTLGHSPETMKDPAFRRLLGNAVLFVTGNLAGDGLPLPGSEPVGDGMDIFESFSAPEGIRFLGADGQDCAFRTIAIAAAPCYAGCIFNPFEWGEETVACKRACEAELPSSDAIIAKCMPQG